MGYPNDLLNPRFLTGMVQKRPTREAIKQGYIGERFLPHRDVPERKLAWDTLVAENNLAGVYDPKGQAIPLDEILFGSMFAELIDVKSSSVLDPDQIQMIRDPAELAVYAGGNSPAWAQAKLNKEKKHLAKRMGMADDAVDTQEEYLRMQVLTTGQILWPPLAADGSDIAAPMAHWNADMPVSIVFPMSNSFKQQATSLVGFEGRVNKDSDGNANRVVWSTPGADPVQDLEIILELFLEQTGVSMEDAIVLMSRTLLSKIAFNTTLLNAISGANREQPGARTYASVDEVKTFIKTKLGWNIETYDAHWTYRTRNAGQAPTINRVPFMGRGKVVIFPKGSENGGLGYEGTTYQRHADGQYRTGKYGWSVERREPPHDIKVGVNIVTFPVIEQYDWFIFDAES